MKTQTKNQKNLAAINSGDCSSQRVLVMSMQSEGISSAELQGIILPMRLLLQMKQPSGSKLTAQVSISIFRESKKTDTTTLSFGMQPNGPCQMKEGDFYVQTTLPLTYPTSARKQKPCASNSSAIPFQKPSSSRDRRQQKLPLQSQAKAKKFTCINQSSSTKPSKAHSATSTATFPSKK